MLAFTCDVRRSPKKGGKPAHKMPISRFELAETAPDLALCSRYVVLP